MNIRDHILDGTPADIVERYEALPALAQATDFGPLDRNVVVVDTETTGLSFNHDELIQIAAARLEQGEITDWFVTFVNPGQFLSEDIVNLTHIHDTDLIGAPTPQEALAQLVEFAGDATMVAHNVGFDRTFVTRHPEGYPLLENQWVDTLDLSRIALPRLKSHRLIDLVHTFGAPVSTHRADDDVAATCVIYRILLAAVSSMPEQLVNAIANMTTLQDWPTAYVFQQFAEHGNAAAGERKLAPTPTTAQQSAPSGAEDNIHQPATSNLNEETPPEPEETSAAGGAPIRPVITNLNEETSFGPEETSAAGGAPIVGASFRSPAAEGGRQKERSDTLFSLRTMRQKRILQLPVRSARKDADELVGALTFPSKDEIEAAFTAEGALGRIYDDYEPRDEQRTMAAAIAETFAAGENLVVEAGTGVGKSMAYLVPAALTAQRNNIAVGIATKTNSLLDQLVYQELPALAEALERVDEKNPPLTWAPLKGMAHYPCLRKLNRLADDGPGMREVAGTPTSQAPALAALLSYVEQSEYDDLDSLKIDYRALPRYLFTTTSSECLRRKCPFHNKLCFVHGARRRAELADIVVTNHTLLFCDVAADGGLLPTIRHWVIDEAHATENEARAAFAETLDSDELGRIAGRVGASAGGRSVFAHAERALSSGSPDQLTLFFGLLAKGKAAGEAFAAAANDYRTRVKELLYFDPAKSRGSRRRGPVYDHVDIWINADVRHSQVFSDVAGVAMQLVEASDKLIKAIQDLVGYLEGIDEAAVSQRELAALAYDLRTVRNAAELIFQTAPESHAYQVTIHRKKDRFTDKAQALVLDVGEKMNEAFYSRTHSVIFASATLAVGESFGPFEEAIGLNRTEFSHARELMLDSSYDFDNNMIVYVVKDMPEPNDPAYAGALHDLLARTHLAQRGSMLTLFTNRREMENAFEAVNPQLKSADLRLVCQKYGISPKTLRDDFLADEHLSLFALKSFWEGFDAPGATLRGVVIPKLPFARPTDPLYCERANRDDRAWWHYVLPQAVIETKQAAGRLIRKADDHGVLILADKRLVTKTYGKTFLKSLQSRTVRFATADEVVRALEMMA